MSVIDNATLRLIDADFDKANFRATFRFPTDSVILSDIKLLDVGISSAGADSYQPTVGSAGAISAIRLYDGGVLLDSIENFTVYNSFKNLNKTNDENISLNRHLNNVGVGFVQSGGQGATGSVLDDADFQLNGQNITANNIGSKSWISLRTCLPFLRESMVVPTTLYRQLRLEVSYHTAAGLMNLVQADRTAALNTLTGAFVACHEVSEGDVRDEMARSYQGVVYHPYEFDNAICNAITTAATNDNTKLVAQNNHFLLHGFNNKKLKRILVVSTPTDSATWISGTKNQGYANNASQAQFRENTQIRVNGVDKLVGGGVGSSGTGSGKNKRLALTTDAWGDINLIPGQQFTQTPDFNNYVGGDDLLRKTQGAVDYFGCIVEEKIDSLQIFYDRSGVDGNASLVQQLRLNIMGQVEKAVIVNNGEYRVIYT
tara:strand:- start:1984 stop:3270 length:1287 start_codon:yes stop_codon:yes gene_type:complete